MASIVKRPLNLTAAVRQRLSSLSLFSGSSGSGDSDVTRYSELTRVPSLVEGCDYKHWLVVMEVPKGYPPRDDIVRSYIKTLAIALGSEDEAKRSLYSVSTKYYYAFGCRVPEFLTCKIKSLPDVKWVLPDSFVDDGENGYGGEPFIDGEVLPYDEKYHADWLRDQDDTNAKGREVTKKSRRKRKKNSI